MARTYSRVLKIDNTMHSSVSSQVRYVCKAVQVIVIVNTLFSSIFAQDDVNEAFTC